MKIDLSKIDIECFAVREVDVANEICYLVNPKPNFFDWTEDLLHFRSSVWNSDGELISAGFKKFFNLGERPAIDPLNSFENVNVVEKLDGSCLIVSRYKGQTIIRTRGSIDARHMSNGDEIDYLTSLYSKFFNFVESDAVVGDKGTKGHSYLFEWTSPRNKIVIDYGNSPDIKLMGVIEHSEYRLAHQDVLDLVAKDLLLRRPNRYYFKTQAELVANVKDFLDKEGVCIYYDNDQHIRKVKSALYLKLHAFKSNLSIVKMAELFFETQKFLSNDPLPTENVKKDFESYIQSTFDYECLVESQQLINDLFDKLTTWYSNLQLVGNFVSANKHLEQKEFALSLIDWCKDLPHLSSFGFKIRSGQFNPSIHKKKFVDLLSEGML